MATKNYKSDFNFILHLYSVLTDSAGKEKERTELPWPDYDWSAKFWTSSKANAYYASCIGGVCTNCRNMDGKIQIVVDNHNMGLGTLQVEFRAELPREIYPDGSERNVVPGVLDIELVRGAGDFPSDFEAQLQMPYIKLKYDDLTEEEKAEFQRPVTEATESLQKFQTTAEEAEVKREANEKRRIQMEDKIGAREQGRQTSEVARMTAENERIEAEADRKEAETSRVSAEEKRAEEFAAWETEIDGKADRSELSNVLAEESDDGAILKERSTGEVMYPQTLASLVKISDGESVDEALGKKQDALTPSEDVTLSGTQLTVTDEAKLKVFMDTFNQAAGNDGYARITDGAFDCQLNGLTLTYEEALAVDRESSGPNFLYSYSHAGVKSRTLYPIASSRGSYGSDAAYSFANCTKLEVLNFGGSGYVYVRNNTFFGCRSLRRIINGNLSIEENSLNLPNIEDFTVTLRLDMNLSKAPKVSLASLQYLVANATNTAPITITVHPDVYAKLTGDTTNEAAAALTAEELAAWQQVLADAVAKNISFATT